MDEGYVLVPQIILVIVKLRIPPLEQTTDYFSWSFKLITRHGDYDMYRREEAAAQCAIMGNIF